MNIKNLLYFEEVCKCGSINRAAQNLYVSQPALSLAIKALEDELGYKVFSRKSSGISLTPEGELFIKSATVISEEYKKIINIPLKLEATHNLSIVSCNSATFMNNFIQFKKENPLESGQDSFKETGPAQSFKDIIAEKYRVSLLYCFKSKMQFYKDYADKYNLSMDILCSNIPAVVLVSKKNPIANKKGLYLKELAQKRIVAYESFEFNNWLGALNIPKTANVMYIYDRGGLVDAVKNDNYIAIVIGCPNIDDETDSCIELPILDLEDSVNVCVVKHKSYCFNSREKKFIKLLRSKIGYINLD